MKNKVFINSSGTALLFAIALCLWAFPGHTASLNDLMGPSGQDDQQKISLNVACGGLKKANCATVLPHLAQYAASQGNVQLVPIESEGSVQSTLGVCKKFVPAAIVQFDAADAVTRDPSNGCWETIKKVGKSIYPYFGYLIVRSDFPHSSIYDMTKNKPKDRPWKIADGVKGTGGQVTFENIIKYEKLWAAKINTISIVEGVADRDAEWNIDNGNIDGFFIMDGRNSSRIKDLLEATDKDGKAKYKVLDVRLNDKFYGDDGPKNFHNNGALYSEGKLAGGFFRNTYTVTVDAIFIMNGEFLRTKDGSRSARAVSDGLEKARPGINSDLTVPDSWNAR